MRAAPVVVVSISKREMDPLSEDALGGIRRFTQAEVQFVKPNPSGTSEPAVQRAKETGKVLAMLKADDYVIVLDERGGRASRYEPRALVGCRACV